MARSAKYVVRFRGPFPPPHLPTLRRRPHHRARLHHRAPNPAFTRIRMAHRRRRQPQRRCRGLLPQERRRRLEGRSPAAAHRQRAYQRERASVHRSERLCRQHLRPRARLPSTNARFVLSDPDGVDGKTENLVTVRTRFEPKPATGGAVYHVYPSGLSTDSGSSPPSTVCSRPTSPAHHTPTTSIRSRRASSPAM